MSTKKYDGEEMKYPITKLATVACFSLAAGLASAQNSGISYDHVDVDLVKGDIADVDMTAFSVAGMTSLSESVFARASYTTGESDDKYFGDEIEQDAFRIGLGYHMPISSVTDFVVALDYVKASVDHRGFDDDANGYGIDAGVRSMLSDRFEVSGFISYVDIDNNDDFGVSIQGTYYLAPTVGINFGYSDADDLSAYRVGVRFTF